MIAFAFDTPAAATPAAISPVSIRQFSAAMLIMLLSAMPMPFARCERFAFSPLPRFSP